MRIDMFRKAYLRVILLSLCAIVISGFWVSQCHGDYDGSLLSYEFPSELSLTPGEDLTADLTVTVKNTGDQRWTACLWFDKPYPSYQVVLRDLSWKPSFRYGFAAMYHVNEGATDTFTTTLGGEPPTLPEEGGLYSFVLECEYHTTACSESYETMNGTPIIVKFKILFPEDQDKDGDGLLDNVEIEETSCTNPNDADSDDDGVVDGDEDINKNGIADPNEINPCDSDSDDDGIDDGTEMGILEPVADPDGEGPLLGTDINMFKPDMDQTTTTDPLNPDSDGDGLIDGEEDLNHNGRVDSGETDPKEPAFPWELFLPAFIKKK